MDSINIPDGLLNSPVSEWQLNGVTLVLAIMVVGRAYKAIRNGGGLIGLWHGLLFGTNTQKEEEKK